MLVNLKVEAVRAETLSDWCLTEITEPALLLLLLLLLLSIWPSFCFLPLHHMYAKHFITPNSLIFHNQGLELKVTLLTEGAGWRSSIRAAAAAAAEDYWDSELTTGSDRQHYIQRGLRLLSVQWVKLQAPPCCAEGSPEVYLDIVAKELGENNASQKRL